MKRTIWTMLLALIGLLLVGCVSEKEFDFEDGVLIVGLEADYPPFNWTESTKSDTNYPIDGTNLFAEGYDVQIAIRLAEELGLELVIKKIDWDGLIESLKSGMIDVIIAGMSPTARRMQSISFTEEYYASTHVVVVSATGAYQEATEFTDFEGAKVVGQRGTVYDDLAKQLASRGNATYQAALDTVPQSIYAISTGMVDATILEEPVAKGVILKNPNLTYIRLTTSFTLEYEDEVVAIGVRKADNALRIALNEALQTITQEERIALMDQYTIQSEDVE